VASPLATPSSIIEAACLAAVRRRGGITRAQSWSLKEIPIATPLPDIQMKVDNPEDYSLYLSTLFR
jgi:hypothetical protein